MAVKPLLRLLLSRLVAVGAIGLLAGLFAISSFVPDRDGRDEIRTRRPALANVFDGLAPERLAQSPLVLGLTSFVALGVAASIVTRIRARVRSAGPKEAEQERFRAEIEVVVPESGEAAWARVREVLRANGFRAGDRPEGASGSTGFWGSMAFHAGLLVLLGGIVASALGRFHGEIVLTETAPVRVSADTMLFAVPVEKIGALAGTVLEVEDVLASYRSGTHLTDVSAVLAYQTPGGGAGRRFVSVNVPVDVGEHQVALHRYGFAPVITATRPDGTAALDGVAVLRVLPPGTEDSLVIDAGGVLRVRFYPDFAGGSGPPASRTLDPVRPVLAWRWYERGELVASGEVARGERQVVNGYELAFPELLRWASFVVGRDPGIPWFAAGAFLSIAGLAARLAGHERAWRAELTPAGERTRVRLTLSARYFPALLREKAERMARTFAEEPRA